MSQVLVKYPVVGAPGFQVVVVCLPSGSSSVCIYCHASVGQAISWGRSTPRGICLASFRKPVCPKCQEIAAGQMAERVLAIVGLAASVVVSQGGRLMTRYHDPSLGDGSSDQSGHEAQQSQSGYDANQASDRPLTSAEQFILWLQNNPFGCGM